MNRYRFSQLSSGALLRTLHEQAAHERGSTALLVALIAEVDQRRLYREHGYSSMFDYCVRRLHLSEDSAYKRLQAARVARRFPGVFEAIADGRLSLTVIVKLRPHLTRENWRELLSEAVHKTKTEIEHLLAVRFPKPEVPTVIQPVAPVGTSSPVASPAPGPETLGIAQLVPEPVASIAPAIDAASLMGTNGQAVPGTHPVAPARVAPLSAETYRVQFTMRQTTHDKLRRLQELLGHRVPAGDLDAVLEHAFDAAISQIEKRKLGATDKPRRAKPSRDPRHIPAHVKRAVAKRDGNRCAFVGDDGHRCEARRDLEFDHIWPVARGGESTVANVRLLCRAHNQLEAEREFGHALMKGRREAVTEARASTPTDAPMPGWSTPPGPDPAGTRRCDTEDGPGHARRGVASSWR